MPLSYLRSNLPLIVRKPARYARTGAARPRGRFFCDACDEVTDWYLDVKGYRTRCVPCRRKVNAEEARKKRVEAELRRNARDVALDGF